MSIVEVGNFRFRQYEVQDQGGWCYGISLSLLSHLVECQRSNSLDIFSAKSFHDARVFSQMMHISRNTLTNTTLPGFMLFRQRVMHLQTRNETRRLPERNPHEIHGAVLLDLSLGPKEGRLKAGSAFRAYDISYSSNHIGLAVFERDGRVFVFDPNCGGALVDWQPDPYIPTAVELVDSVLYRLYCLYDREEGARIASLKRFSHVDFNELSFGNAIVSVGRSII